MSAIFAVEEMARRDWTQVRTIFGEGLATGLAAFMLSPPVWTIWNAGHLPFARFVARNNEGAILGWSALSAVPDT